MPFMDPDSYVTIGTGNAAGVIGLIVVIYLIVVLAIALFGIVSYVLQALGMYTIAERRGIRNGWLAFIPFGAAWILGSIADQYQYVAKGKVKNRRKWLLGLNIALVVGYFAWFIVFMATGIFAAPGAGSENTAIAVAVIGASVFFALAIVLYVVYYISLYNLFVSCEPDNATLYLVLGILFSVALPFFIFAARKKDNGMPPRKVESVAQIAEPVAEAAEPAEEAPAEEESAPTEEGFANPEEFEEE